MPVMSSRGTGRPANSRISTQSKPFSFGLRAQPGAPSTGRPPAVPTSSRLPGSTGMPKCSMVPPIASTAAGMTSRRSAIAEAPNTMTSSAPALSTSSSARASARCSCGTRRSATILAPAGASRSAVTLSVFSITLSRAPAARSRSRRLCGCDRARRAAAASCAGKRGIARCTGDRERNDFYRRDHLAGDDRLVSRQRRERDRLVDALNRSMASRSTTRMPDVSANKLARPVKARSTRTPSPAMALAIRPPRHPRRHRPARAAPR